MKVKIFLVLLILVFSLGAVSAQDNSGDLSIDEVSDELCDGEVEKTFDDIQAVVDNAEVNDTINLEGCYVASDESINISKSITLDGQGKTIIDGCKLNGKPLFQTFHGNIVFKNMKFVNSNHTVMKSESGKLTVDNCQFKDNPGYFVIYGLEADCLVNNSLFENNSNSCIEANRGLTVTNCNFTNNYQDGVLRDIITIYSNNVVIGNNNFIGNNNSCICVMDNYYCLRSNISIMNSNFINNIGKVFEIYGNNIIDINIINCDFINNSGFYSYTSNFIEGYVNLIDNCSFISNKGAMEIFPNQSSTLSIINSIFKNNAAHYITEPGDNEFLRASSENMISCEFVNNTGSASLMGNIKDCIFKNNNAYRGGAITWCDRGGSIVNCSFMNNSADLGGAIYVYCYDSSLKMVGNTFAENSDLRYNDIYGNFTMGLTKNSFYYGEKIALTIKDKTTKEDIHDLRIYYMFDDEAYSIHKIDSGNGKYYDSLNLKLGRHNVTINCYDNSFFLETKITIKKAPTTVKAPKVTNKFKKSKYFKVKVKNKITKDLVKNTYIKLKIDKKTYNVKTNSKGVAKFNTKKLKVGKHKVTISSGSDNYDISAKSSIRIRR